MASKNTPRKYTGLRYHILVLLVRHETKNQVTLMIAIPNAELETSGRRWSQVVAGIMDWGAQLRLRRVRWVLAAWMTTKMMMMLD